MNAKKQPMRNHETVSVFYKKPGVYNPQMTTGHELKKSARSSKHQTDVYGEMKNNNNYSSTERYPRSIQVFSTDTQNSSIHPTQKPEKMFEYFIKTYTNKGDIVLDNCIGSGTTAIACMNTDRNFIGFEKDEAFYRDSVKRIKNNQNQLSLL